MSSCASETFIELTGIRLKGTTPPVPLISFAPWYVSLTQEPFFPQGKERVKAKTNEAKLEQNTMVKLFFQRQVGANTLTAPCRAPQILFVDLSRSFIVIWALLPTFLKMKEQCKVTGEHTNRFFF